MWKRTYLLQPCNTADSRDTLYIRGQTDYLVFAIDCTFENLQTILCLSSTVHSKTCRLSCVCHRLYIRRPAGYLVFVIDCTFEDLQAIWCLSSTVHSICRWSAVQTILCLLSFFVHLLVILKIWILSLINAVNFSFQFVNKLKKRKFFDPLVMTMSRCLKSGSISRFKRMTSDYK